MENEEKEISLNKRKIRNNGFELPLNYQQIISWIGFFLILFSYFTINSPIFPQDEQIFYGVSFMVVISFVVYYTLKATASNPSQNNYYMKNCENAKFRELYIKNLKFYCKSCQIYVHDGTKHCGKCSKCIFKFDHHCKWLNNCIGHQNYSNFLIKNDLYHPQVYLSLVLLSFIIDGVIFLFTSHLLALHIYLQARGITTFQYVIESRRKNKIFPKRKGKFQSNFTSSLHSDDYESPAKTNPNILFTDDNRREICLNDTNHPAQEFFSQYKEFLESDNHTIKDCDIVEESKEEKLPSYMTTSQFTSNIRF